MTPSKGALRDHSNYGTRRRIVCPKCGKLVAVSNTERVMRHKCQAERLLTEIEGGQ